MTGTLGGDPMAADPLIADGLYFLPLGGAGEIGMNLNLYGLDGRWLMVDLGVTFRDDAAPGADVVTPDPEFILERLDSLAGLVLTHGHEDHIGAVPHLWDELRCPIYATPFTAALVRRKLAEAGLAGVATIHEIPLKGRFSIGPFDLELVTLTHSIPEPNALVLKTPYGTVLHTGDWKMDPEPLIGETVDSERLRALGDSGVLAVVCDSTNALVPGEAGSEGTVREELCRLIAGLDGGRVAVALFASNVARFDTVARAAMQAGRQCVLAGRSLWRMNEAARETGYLADLPAFVTERDGANLSRDEMLLICTGSQGEPRSALARMARDDHPHLHLDAGDHVLFSSRVIPGNEAAIGQVQNRLVRLGVNIITAQDKPIHVSGHPARDELARLYQWVRPEIVVPVHGEMRHMQAHAALARSCQVAHTPLVENGRLIRLAPGKGDSVASVFAGRLALDGERLVPLGGEILRGRQRLAANGIALATLVVTAAGELAAAPKVSLTGLIEPDEDDIVAEAVTALAAAVRGLPAGQRRDDGAVAETARRALRRAIQAAIGKKPVTDIHVIRV